MSSKTNNEHASADLFSFIGKISNYATMNDFQNHYKSLIKEYFSKPNSSLLSEIDVSNLDSFKNWAPEVIQNKNKIYPLLISKLLQGDIFALNIFDNLHKMDNKLQFTMSYSKIHSDRLLTSKFNEYGSAEDSRAFLTAEYWLKSQEAAEVMEQNENGLESLCSIIGMMHIDNEYIHC